MGHPAEHVFPFVITDNQQSVRATFTYSGDTSISLGYPLTKRRTYRSHVRNTFDASWWEVFYKFRDKVEVVGFVNKNPFLEPLLLQATSHIYAYFPKAIPVLEVMSDPETNERQLLLSVKTDLEIEEAIENFKELQGSWWFPNRYRANSTMMIDLEFE